MRVGLETRLLAWRGAYGDPLLTALTLLLAVLMFVVAPLQAAGIRGMTVLGAAVGLLLVLGGLVVSGSIAVFVIMLAALGLNSVAVISRLHVPSSRDVWFAGTAWLMFAVALSFVVGRAVFAPGRVTYHRVIGAILLYLLIAMAFSALFGLLALVVPNAFSGLSVEDSPALAANLVYFSFVTLTSTGYGDIVPVHPLARSLCNLETIAGQLYPATLLARLVTLELQGRS